MKRKSLFVVAFIASISMAGCYGPRYTDPYDGTFVEDANMNDRGLVSTVQTLFNDGIALETNPSPPTAARDVLAYPCHSNDLSYPIKTMIRTLSHQFEKDSLKTETTKQAKVTINGEAFFPGQTEQLDPGIYARLEQISEALAGRDDIKTTLLVKSPQHVDINLRRAQHIERFLNARGVHPKLTDAFPDQSEDKANPWPFSVTWLFCVADPEHGKIHQPRY